MHGHLKGVGFLFSYVSIEGDPDPVPALLPQPLTAAEGLSRWISREGCNASSGGEKLQQPT